MLNTYKKKQLSDRWHVFWDGSKVQRDLYSAFLIYCTADTLDQIDQDLCILNFLRFKQLHDQEILRLQTEDNKTLRWYIA